MDYRDNSKNIRVGAYNSERVHSWKPPCGCGVELNEVKDLIGQSEKVHSWKPPCGCGVSLKEIISV